MEDEYEEYPPALPSRGGPGIGTRRPAPITPKGYDDYEEDYYAPPPKRVLKSGTTAVTGRYGERLQKHFVLYFPFASSKKALILQSVLLVKAYSFFETLQQPQLSNKMKIIYLIIIVSRKQHANEQPFIDNQLIEPVDRFKYLSFYKA
ncbi:unnamed protein product, partial [Callosobruchus maculatus]